MDDNSLSQGKYPWGIIQNIEQTASSLNSRFIGGYFYDKQVSSSE